MCRFPLQNHGCRARPKGNAGHPPAAGSRVTRTAHAAKTSSPSNGSRSAAGGRRLRDRRAQEERDSRHTFGVRCPVKVGNRWREGRRGLSRGISLASFFYFQGRVLFWSRVVSFSPTASSAVNSSAILLLESDNHRPCQKFLYPLRLFTMAQVQEQRAP